VSNGQSWKYLSLFSLAAAVAIGAAAQNRNSLVQQRLAEMRQAVAANKRQLGRYTWQEKQIVSVNGQVKKESLYQVRLGPNGEQQKTLIMSTPEAAKPGGGPLKRHIVEKKTEEFQQYAQQVGALAHSYSQPDAERLQQAFESGNVTLGPAGPGQFELIVTNYLKPGDSVRYIFNRPQHAIQRVVVSSYLTNPSDAVTMDVQFAKLPDGTNHAASSTINGVSKQLVVQDTNSNYVRAA
jgi:hypothetical protein